MQGNNFLTFEPIQIPAILASLDSQETGGIVIFSGIVRNHSKGRAVSYLEYEAYEPLAKKKIKEIIDNAREHWKLYSAICIHRLGCIEISECAVLVLTGSAHRAQAYEANRYIIDHIKTDVPIWKNEFFTDGSSEWGRNCETCC